MDLFSSVFFRMKSTQKTKRFHYNGFMLFPQGENKKEKSIGKTAANSKNREKRRNIKKSFERTRKYMVAS